MYGGGANDGAAVDTNYYVCGAPNALSRYYGGISNGYSSTNIIQKTCENWYLGGIEDGSGSYMDNISNCPPPVYTEIYKGGEKDGYGAMILLQISCENWYLGGIDDGGDVGNSVFYTCSDPDYRLLYRGGEEDGYSGSIIIQKICESMYSGGIDDGSGESDIIYFSCPPPIYTDLYKGGDDDGYESELLIQIICNVLYSGGYEDGAAVGSSFVCSDSIWFVGIPDSICRGESVNFTPYSYRTQLTNFYWSFEGGVPLTSTERTPTVRYRQKGKYDVTLVAWNDTIRDTIRYNDYITVGVKPINDSIIVLGSTNLCECGAVTLVAPAGHTFTWSNGQTTQSIDVYQSGVYSVTIDDCYVPINPVVINITGLLDEPQLSTNGFDYNTITLYSSPAVSYYWSPNGETTDSIIVNSSGTYWVQISDGSGCTKESQKAKVKIGGVCNEAALATKLIYFRGIPINNEWIMLKWETTTELNNNYYVIEKSKNGKTDWFELLKEKSTGNINSKSIYSVYDKEPYMGISYYKLKSVDNNGISEYLGYIAITMYPKQVYIKDIYPNPTEDFLNYSIINNIENTKIKILITDVLGQILKEESYYAVVGETRKRIDVRGIESGVYFITFKAINAKKIDNDILIYKFIRQ